MAMQPGMITSIEPALYRPKQYGIRIENLYVVKDLNKVIDGKRYFGLEPLTWIPMDERLIDRDDLTKAIAEIKKMMVTLYSPGDLQTLYVIERRAPGQWNFYSLTRTRMASSLMPTGGDASYINRAVAFYRLVAGIPTDQEPPAAR